MPLEAGEMIRRSYEAFQARDRKGLVALYCPDAVWDMTNWIGWPDTRVYEGHAGLVAWLDVLAEAFGELIISPVEISDLGDGRAFVLGALMIRGRTSGAPVDAPPFAQIVEFRDGLISRVTMYSDVDAGRRAAGI